MAAFDVLNVHQWPLDEVGALRSGNRPGMSVSQEYEAHKRGDWTEGEVEHAHDYGYVSPAHYQADLTRHMADHGQARPGFWGQGDRDLGENESDRYLVNGFHRYAAHRDLGHASMNLAEYPKEGFVNTDGQVPGWKGAR